VDARGDDAVRLAVGELQAARAALAPLAGIPLLVRPDAAVRISPPNPAVMIAHRKGKAGEYLILHNRSLVENAGGTAALRGAKSRGVRFDIPPYGLEAIRYSDGIATARPQPQWRDNRQLQAAWSVGEPGGPATPVAGLEDWRRWKGREEFSGTMRYRTRIPFDTAAGRVALDLGEVGEIAEVRINGKPAGVRIAPPYQFDITKLVQPGLNTIEVDVTNTAQAKWDDAFSRGDAVSGLLGPVRILCAPKN